MDLERIKKRALSILKNYRGVQKAFLIGSTLQLNLRGGIIKFIEIS